MKLKILGKVIVIFAWLVSLVNIFLQFYNEKIFEQVSIKKIWHFIWSGSSIGTPLYKFSVIILIIAMMVHIVGAFMEFEKTTRISYCSIKGLEIIGLLICFNEWIDVSTGMGILFFLILEGITIFLYAKNNIAEDYFFFLFFVILILGSSIPYALYITLLCLYIIAKIIDSFK